MEDSNDLFGWVGATVDGKYRVDAVVGMGGFGIVYKAHHLGFDQTVAVKCLRLPQSLSAAERERFRETFLGEGRLLHQLSRANAGIVQALDLGAAVSPNKHWTPYLILEWLEGLPLDRDFSDRRSANAPMRSLAEATELLGTAARALAVAHAQGVAHRDIKPANLFIAKVAGRSVVKVLDFGIAKVMSETESVTRAFEETGASMQAFTARYGAPEQFSRRYGATGPWTDVFALALVFVEAVLGRQALDGRDATQLFVAAADSERRPTLRTLGFPTSDAVEAVLARALAVDPRARYANAGEFWEALEAGIAGESVGALRKAALITSPQGDVDWARANALTAAEPAASAPTELNSSAQIPGSSRAGSKLSVGRVLGVGAAALVMGGSLTIAITLFTSRSRAPSPTAVSAEAASGAGSAAPRSLPASLVGNAEPSAATPAPANPASPAPANPASPAPSASVARTTAASSGPAEAKAAPLAGMPVRDVPAGPVGRGYIGPYRLLARDGGTGRDFYGAAKECRDIGMSLCSEAQWVHACSSFPELGSVATWTSTVKGERITVRGGESCASEGQAAPIERALNRYGMCCERAIQMTTDNLQKNYLNSIAERIFIIENALNQRNVQALLDLSEPSVVVDEQAKSQAELKRSIEADFRTAPDLIVQNDTCDVSVQAKKVTTKPTRRKKKQVVYQTQGWTAECRQTAMLPASVSARDVSYAFTAASKLREIATEPAE